MIHLLKYDRIRSAAVPLGKLIAIKIKAGDFGARPLLVPVPLFRSKFRDRSFNQAEEICRVARKSSGVAMDPYVLMRRRDTGSQTGLTPLQRRENVRGAFQVRRRALRDLPGRNIILVDDVLTTGATVNECARVLKRAGAANVFVITVARVTRMLAAMQPVEEVYETLKAGA